MKRTLALAISVLMTAAPLAAQHGGGPKPKTTHGAPAPKATHAAPRQHGPATHGSSAPKVGKTSHGGGHAPKVAKSTSPVKTTKAPKTTKTTKTAKTTRTSTTVASGTALTPVQLKLQRNTNLASKLQSRLPAGTDLTLAAAGFRNLGQFVAAVNVSNNLGIPFSQLKTRMVDQGMSLGQAIQDARPTTTGTGVIVSRAETDADGLIRTTEQKTAAKSKKAKTRGGN
jgi:hypothetical protein